MLLTCQSGIVMARLNTGETYMEDPKKNVTLMNMVMLNVVNLGLTGFWAFDGAVMPLFLTLKFGLSNTAISLILGIGKFMIVMSMFFGLYSDLTEAKWGKRRPLILIGGIIAAPLIVLIPHLPGVWSLIAALTVIYFGIQFAAVPYFSLVPEVVPNEKLGTANAFFSVFGGVGTILAYMVLLSIIYKVNKPLAFLVMGGLVFAGVIVTVLFTKEHPQETPKVNKWKIVAGSLGEVLRDRPNYPSLFRFLVMNLFFWFGLGAFIVYFTKAMEYYANVPGETAAMVLGTVVIVSILFAVPVGILGDKISRKNMTLFGLVVIFLGMSLGYFLVGPSSSVSGLDLGDVKAVERIAANYGMDMEGVDISGFVKEEFDPPKDVNADKVKDIKSDIMRWCLNGALIDEPEKGNLNCSNAIAEVLGSGNPALETTSRFLNDMGARVQKETKKVLTISFGVIAFAAIGLTVCFVLTATILPTLMPNGKLGLYMGFYSTLTGVGQLLSLLVAGQLIDRTVHNPALGYRSIFIQGAFFLFISIIALSGVKYIPKANEPQISELEREGKEFRL